MKDFFNENRNKCIIGLFVTMFLIVMLVTGCLDDIVVGSWLDHIFNLGVY